MKPQIPEKMPTPLSELNLGGNGIHPPVVTAYEYNKLIDYLTARQELEDTRYKELTSRIDTIAGNQLEMKRGDQPIFQDIAPEEEADDDGIDWDERDEEHRKRNGAKVKDQPKRWRANNGGAYFMVWSDGSIGTLSDDMTSADNFRYAIGNYFFAREDVEAYKAKLLSDNAQ